MFTNYSITHLLPFDFESFFEPWELGSPSASPSMGAFTWDESPEEDVVSPSSESDDFFSQMT